MKKILAFVLIAVVLAACSLSPDTFVTAAFPNEPPLDIQPITIKDPAPEPGEPPDGVSPAPAVTPAPALKFPDNFAERVDGSTATIPLTAALFGKLGISAENLTHGTTDWAYSKLFDGLSDVIFVTYPSEDEQRDAVERLGGIEVMPVVKDALVFLLNKDNPVDNLTREQARDIYAGKITNWKEVGGNDAPITAFQRPVNSGSQTLFLKLAMNGAEPADAPSELRPQAMGELIDAVAYYDDAPNSLGYSVFYYATEMYESGRVKLLSIDGVSPAPETIADGSYPYVTYYYAVMPKGTKPGSAARNLVDYALSEEGQETAAAAGYVPLKPLGGYAGNLQWGYYGSDPENTSKSAGTGGEAPDALKIAAGKPLILHGPDISDDYSFDYDNNRMVNLKINGNDALTEKISAWFADAWDAGAEARDELSFFTGLYNVNTYSGGDEKAAVFTPDGTQLKLSDVFYDGVNYIEYINDTLFDPGKNRYLSSDSYYADAGLVLSRPFTGIPNDYPLFRVTYTYIGAALEIILAEDNPFIPGSSAGYSPHFSLPLPAELSPYGNVYDVSYEKVTAAPRVNAALPRVRSLISGMTETDKIINEKIKKAYESTIKSGVYDRRSEAIFENPNPDYEVIFEPSVMVSGDKLYVAFCEESQTFEPNYSRVLALVSVSLTTGKDAPLKQSDLPDDWRKRAEVYTGYGFADPPIKLSSKAKASHIRVAWGGWRAEVADGGEIYAVYIYE